MTDQAGAAAHRLRIGLIGVGRAGSVLAAALARAGHHVARAHAVSDASIARAEALIPQARLVSVPEVAVGCDLLLITVPDDVLPSLVSGLVGEQVLRPGQLICHASGRYGIEVLSPATAVGAIPLALHPAMTLTGTTVDLQRLDGAPFAVTAPGPARPIAEALVVEMGGEPIWVPESARATYHAALTHAHNHLVTLVADAMQILSAAGIEDSQRLLAPLLSAGLDNVLRSGDAALTGPVSRGDAGTVAAHLDTLAAIDPAIRDGYLALARRTADRALAAGRLSPARAEALLDLLARSDTEPPPAALDDQGDPPCS